MFREAQEADKAKILAFAGKEPELNLFLLGDLEFYGFGHDFLKVWVEEDGAGNLRTILLKFHGNMMLCGENAGEDPQTLLELIAANGGEFLNCPGTIIPFLKPYLPKEADVRPMKMARMKALRDPGFPLEPASLALPEDAGDIIRAMWEIEEFRPLLTGTPEQRIPRTESMIRSGFQVHYLVRKDGVLAAHATTSVASSRAAMIGGVFTSVKFRGQGLGTAVVARLCKELLDSGKTPVLFFENPKAASIYHRLGFEDFADWIIVRLKAD